MELETRTFLGLKVVVAGSPDQLGRPAVMPRLGTVRSAAHLLGDDRHKWSDSCEPAAEAAACAKTHQDYDERGLQGLNCPIDNEPARRESRLATLSPSSVKLRRNLPPTEIFCSRVACVDHEGCCLTTQTRG